MLTGMQRLVILEAEPWGLDLNLKILPQYLNSVGYNPYLVGKWHLGFFEKRYMPTERGFTHFFGYFQGHQDYFTRRCHETVTLANFPSKVREFWEIPSLNFLVFALP